MALKGVQQARVHLAQEENSSFVVSKRAPSKASVMLQLEPGYKLSSDVGAIVNLVANSVPNLKPEDVGVVDQYGALLARTQRRRRAGAELAGRGGLPAEGCGQYRAGTGTGAGPGQLPHQRGGGHRLQPEGRNLPVLRRHAAPAQRGAAQRERAGSSGAGRAR